MEGRDEKASLAEQHRLALVLGEDFDSGAGLADARGANEDAPQGHDLVLELEVGLEARDLAAERVSLDVDVHLLERAPACEQDHPGTGPEHGVVERPNRILEPVEAYQSRDRGGLAPGTISPSSPSSCSGFRTAIPSTPRRASTRRCSRKLPWTARTPIRRSLSMSKV